MHGLSRELQSPAFATAAGLLLWALYEDARAIHYPMQRMIPENGQILDKVGGWLRSLLPD